MSAEPAAVLAAIAADVECAPTLDASRCAVLSREDAATASAAAVDLGAVVVAVPVPGVRDAFRVYVREAGCVVGLAGADLEDVAAAVTAARRLAR